MENMELFITGVGATVSALLIFCGSVWLLLTMIMGARLAYFVTASLTIGFVMIMGIVWSIGTPLGPVGELPEFLPEAIAAEAGDLSFDEGSAYPESPWREPDPDNADDTTKAGDLGNASVRYLGEAIEDGEIENFSDPALTTADPDSVRFLERGDTLYGAITIDPQEKLDLEGKPVEDQPNEGQVVAVMQFDAGNPNSTARQIAIGSFVLLALHLWGLGRSERKAKANGKGSE